MNRRYFIKFLSSGVALFQVVPLNVFASNKKCTGPCPKASPEPIVDDFFAKAGYLSPFKDGKTMYRNNTYGWFDKRCYKLEVGGIVSDSRHCGIDLNCDKGQEIVSIADGHVVSIVPDISVWVRHVIVKYKYGNDQYFYAIYGHMTAAKDLTKDPADNKNFVKRGQTIGYIVEKAAAYHLHFGITLNEPVPDRKQLPNTDGAKVYRMLSYVDPYSFSRMNLEVSIGFGALSPKTKLPEYLCIHDIPSADPNLFGFQDPIKYLSNHTNFPVFRIEFRQCAQSIFTNRYTYDLYAKDNADISAVSIETIYGLDLVNIPKIDPIQNPLPSGPTHQLTVTSLLPLNFNNIFSLTYKDNNTGENHKICYPFIDVPLDSDSARYIYNLYQNSVIKRMNGFFRPTDYLTRIQAIIMIIKAIKHKIAIACYNDTHQYGVDLPTSTDQSSAESEDRRILDTAFYYEIATKQTYFLPNNPISRCEFSKFIYISAEKASIQFHELEDRSISKMNDFTSCPKDFQEYVKKLYLSGIVSGFPDNVKGDGFSDFKPLQFIAREHAATLISKAFLSN